MQPPPNNLDIVAAAYFVLMVLTAIVFTVPLSQWVARFVSWDDISLLFGPVAFLIGGVGAGWPSLVKWLLTRAGRIIERKAGGQHHMINTSLEFVINAIVNIVCCGGIVWSCICRLKQGGGMVVTTHLRIKHIT